VDVCILHLTQRALPFLYATTRASHCDSLGSGHTPNLITFYGLVLRILALVALGNMHRPVGPFACLWLLGYAMDCMDGQFARAYEMTSEFGDIFDHTSDVLLHFSLFGYILWRYRVPPVLVVCLILFGLLAGVHQGCQQNRLEHECQCTQPHSISLRIFKYMCPDHVAIPFTRWFGVGTLQIVLILMVGWLELQQTHVLRHLPIFWNSGESSLT
jgi:phosphatidylserine synthase